MPDHSRLAGLPGPIGLLLLAAACQPAAAPELGAGPQVHPGEALAKSACGACHAVERRSVSPMRAAPAFATLVNRPGLTRNTLAVWLRNAHNYPAEMNFTLEPRDAERIAAYLATLREPNRRSGF